MAGRKISEKSLVFDLFHTLVDPDDFRPAGFRRLEASAAVLGVDFALLEAAWNEALPDLVRGRDSVRGLLRRVAHENGRPARTLDIAPAAEALGRYQDLALLHPRREVLELLKRVQQRTIAILTNCHDRDIEAWRQSPLVGLVGSAVFSTKAHVAKPDPEAYAAVVATMGCSPEEVVYVGNGGDDELAGARTAAIGTIVHFTWFDDLRGRIGEIERQRRSSFADVTIGDPAGLAEFLEA